MFGLLYLILIGKDPSLLVHPPENLWSTRGHMQNAQLILRAPSRQLHSIAWRDAFTSVIRIHIIILQWLLDSWTTNKFLSNHLSVLINKIYRWSILTTQRVAAYLSPMEKMQPKLPFLWSPYCLHPAARPR